MNLAEHLELDDVEERPRRVILTVARPDAPLEEDFAKLAQRLAPERLSDSEVEAILSASAPQMEASLQEEAPSPEERLVPQPETGFPWSKAALFASLTFIVLLAAAYMHLHTGVQRLTDELHDLAAIKGHVTRLDTKMGILETKVADLETLPTKTRAALLSSILQEMAQKTQYMSEQMFTPDQQDKLLRAKELVQQVQTELGATH
ncbi:MAG: hypothetical protein JG774_554 [Desulfomicrobiaceae bacterium]|jgi:hypothetical protein|nr:hypothetical protein [Desulfomicrobiaceae bacterium]MDI3492631.1 hypothetical protein [Desulfomicrobiaceae bacterium]MDK2872398.1 hypothetical protein [Desulfomicrobiaceae bacterium]HCF05623.1 hypothetical protein [Desulfomicrobiaceae bacterium]